MIRNNTPTLRLRDLPVGTKLTIVGDRTGRTFTHAVVRPDGYHELHIRGRLVVTACGGTPVSRIDN